MSDTKVVGYGRTSPGTNEEGTSLDGQKRDVEQLCEDKGFDLVGWYEDEDVSGRKTKPHERDGFNELIAHVHDDPDIEAIAVRRKERISREASVQMSIDIILEMHMGRELDVWVAQNEKKLGEEAIDDSANPVERITQEITQVIRSYLKELEAAQTAVNTKQSLKSKKRAGEPVGRTPPGLITDKQLNEEQNVARKYHVHPGNRDKFKNIIDLLNKIEEEGIDPEESGQDPSPHSLGKEYLNLESSDNPTVRVRSLWKNRDDYRNVAQRETALDINF